MTFQVDARVSVARPRVILSPLLRKAIVLGYRNDNPDIQSVQKSADEFWSRILYLEQLCDLLVSGKQMFMSKRIKSEALLTRYDSPVFPLAGTSSTGPVTTFTILPVGL